MPNDILDSYLVLVSPSPHGWQRPYKDFDWFDKLTTGKLKAGGRMVVLRAAKRFEI